MFYFNWGSDVIGLHHAGLFNLDPHMCVDCTNEAGTHSKNETLPLTVNIDFNIIVHPSIGLTLLLESIPAVTLDRAIEQDTHTVNYNQKRGKIRQNFDKNHFSPFKPLERKQIRAAPGLQCAG